ncbi:MAG: hypothetical protein GC156_11395 [Actinomycetales bacterium]|nr:hypothetical protein [Actinomycetales bacterium]
MTRRLRPRRRCCRRRPRPARPRPLRPTRHHRIPCPPSMSPGRRRSARPGGRATSSSAPTW